MGSTINLHQEQSTVSLTAITVIYRSSVRKRNLLYILKWLLTQKEPLKKRRAMKRKQKLILKIRLKKKQKKVKNWERKKKIWKKKNYMKKRKMVRRKKMAKKKRMKEKKKRAKARKKRKNNKHFFIFLTCDKHQYIILASPLNATLFLRDNLIVVLISRRSCIFLWP